MIDYLSAFLKFTFMSCGPTGGQQTDVAGHVMTLCIDGVT